MSQQTSPWLEGAYGWNFGEGNWNSGMDQNLLKFSFLFDRNVDSITASLPAAVNGQAHYLTTDNRLYFAVGTTYFSCPVPKWFIIIVRSTGQTHQFNGTSLVQINTPAQLDSRLDAVELSVSNLITDIANTASATKGAGQVGFNSSLSYAASTVGGRLIDLTNSSDSTKGSALIGYNSLTVRAALLALELRKAGAIFVTDAAYGAIGDGIADDTAAILAAKAAAVSAGVDLVFPKGIYAWTGGNLAASNFTIRAIGQVELKNTGAGIALDLTAGAGGFYNFRMLGSILVSGNATSTNGVHFQALHHSELDLRVKNVPAVAFYGNFGVLSKFRLVCSVNEQPFTITPTKGLLLDKRNTGEFFADCDFDVTIEGVSLIGVDLVEAQGCRFRGTSEANGGVGIRDAAACRYNTWDEFWMEANTLNDAELYGIGNKFNNCRALSTAVTNNIELVSTQGTVFSGGFIRCVNRQVTSFDTNFENVGTSDNASLGFKGTGTYTLSNCWKENTSGVLTSRYTDVYGGRNGTVVYDPPSLADGAGTSTTITVAGALLGDYAVSSFTQSVSGLTITANVTAADTVTVRFQNESGGTLDLASGSLNVKVFQ